MKTNKVKRRGIKIGSAFWLGLGLACMPAQPQPSRVQLPMANQQQADKTRFQAMEREVHQALNQVRKNPRSFIPILAKMARSFRGKRLYLPGQIPIITQEGPSAVTEAIEVLKQTQPLAGCRTSRAMSRAARDHALDLGHNGTASHTGQDGSNPSVRVRRYGTWRHHLAEAIALGSDTGQSMINQLLIDDGVADRGHRKNILSPQFRIVGIACGKHKLLRTICVIDLATAFRSSE